ncbi:MAG: hypothetical protein ABL965_03585 [Nitrospira sp.]|nr:MAG: hypothetical protein E8D44_12005 [Nitrospira sp.]
MEVVVGALTGFVVRVTMLLFRCKQHRKRTRHQPTCLTPFMTEDREMRDLLRLAKTRDQSEEKLPRVFS